MSLGFESLLFIGVFCPVTICCGGGGRIGAIVVVVPSVLEPKGGGLVGDGAIVDSSEMGPGGPSIQLALLGQSQFFPPWFQNSPP